MNAWQQLMELSPRAVAWLATYLMHSTLWLAGAWLAARTVRSPSLREALWKGAVLGGIATSALHGALGSPWWTWPAESGTPAVAAPIPTTAAIERGSEAPAPRAEPAAAARSMPVADLSESEALDNPAGWHAWLLALWLAGSAAGLAHLALAKRRLRSRLRPRRPVAEGPLPAALERLQRRSGLDGVRLTVSAALRSPIVIGTREICLPPRALRELTPEEAESMLAHELAHLARRDGAWRLGLLALERALFLQPLQRLASRRIAADSELACDEQALRWTGDPLALARCLEKVGTWVGAREPRLAVAMVQRRGSLATRVERVLAGANASPTRLQRAALAAALLATCAVLACRGPGVVAEAKEERTYEQLAKAADHLAEITRAIRSGEGALGKLMSDAEVYDQLKLALRVATRSLEEHREAAPDSAAPDSLVQRLQIQAESGIFEMGPPPGGRLEQGEARLEMAGGGREQRIQFGTLGIACEEDGLGFLETDGVLLPWMLQPDAELEIDVEGRLQVANRGMEIEMHGVVMRGTLERGALKASARTGSLSVVSDRMDRAARVNADMEVIIAEIRAGKGPLGRVFSVARARSRLEMLESRAQVLEAEIAAWDHELESGLKPAHPRYSDLQQRILDGRAELAAVREEIATARRELEEAEAREGTVEKLRGLGYVEASEAGEELQVLRALGYVEVPEAGDRLQELRGLEYLRLFKERAGSPGDGAEGTGEAGGGRQRQER